jgi:cytochrome c oxidase assembly factor 1
MSNYVTCWYFHVVCRREECAGVEEPGTSPRANGANTICQASTDLIVVHFLEHPFAYHISTMPPPRIMSALLRARPKSQAQCLRRVVACRFASTTSAGPDPSKPVVPWKTPTSVWSPENLIPPPKDGEILLERRPNRALPPYVYIKTLTKCPVHTNIKCSVPPLISPQVLKTFPLFVIAMVITTGAFFNYQKQESSVVTSTLYALRTNPAVRELLGDEIYFASKYPWIKGEINQVHGRIDINFWVKGTRRQGKVRLRCRRRGRGGLYATQEWSLTMDDGERVELYDPKGDAIDPFSDPVGEDM